MKKKFLAVLLTVTLAFSLVACGEAEKTGNGTGESDKKTEAGASDKGNSDKEDSGKEDKADGNYDETDMWILRTDLSGYGDTFDGTLFYPGNTVPLDMNAIDAFCAPYYVKVSNSEGYNAATFAEAAAMDLTIGTKVRSNSVTIHTRMQHEDGGYTRLDAKDNGLLEIVVCNLGEEELSMSDCYANGWWYAVGSDDNWDKVLLIEDSEERNAEINAVVEKFGTPDYIAPGSSQSYMEEEEWYSYIVDLDTTTYSLVYEYDEYVVALEICDCANRQSTEEPSMTNIYYYPKSYWDAKEVFKTLYEYK